MMGSVLMDRRQLNFYRYGLPAASIFITLVVVLFIWQVRREDTAKAPDRVEEVLETESSFTVPIQSEAEDTGSGVRGEIIIAANRQEAVLRLENLPPVPGRTYQLWLLRGDEAVSLAMFNALQNEDETRVLFSLPENAADYEFFAVTIERSSGRDEPRGTEIFRVDVPSFDEP